MTTSFRLFFTFPRILVFPTIIVLFPIFSRGLFEYMTGNQLTGYIIQFISLILFLATLPLFSRVKKMREVRYHLIFIILFFVAMMVSTIWTMIKVNSLKELAVYDVIMLLLYGLSFTGSILIFRREEMKTVLATSLTVIGAILLFAGTIEWLIQMVYFQKHVYIDSTAGPFTQLLQGAFRSWPGKSFLWLNGSMISRPASLTGSMLHFPIIMPLLGVITWKSHKHIVSKILAVLFILIPFFVFSRSGIVISTVICGLLSVYSIVRLMISFKNQHANKIIFPLLAVVAAALVAVISLVIVPVSRSYLIGIIVRIFNFHDPANSARFSIWSSILTEFSRSNMIFGEFTGMATNIVRNILGKSTLQTLSPFSTGVAESGFLQILTSYGIVGIVGYYGLFACIAVKMFQNKDVISGSALIGVLIQTLFYQSIEVLPFQFSIFSLILLSNSGIQNVRKKFTGPL